MKVKKLSVFSIFLLLSLIQISNVKALDVTFVSEDSVDLGKELVLKWEFSDWIGYILWEIYEDEEFVKMGSGPEANYTIPANHSLGTFNFTIFGSDDGYGVFDSRLITIKSSNDNEDGKPNDSENSGEELMIFIFSGGIFIGLAIVTTIIIFNQKRKSHIRMKT